MNVDYKTQPITFYRIFCVDKKVTISYIGSTVNFKARQHRHKFNCHNPKGECYNYEVYKLIRHHKGWKNWTMVPIETKYFKNKEEANKRELYWINHFESEMNSNNPHPK
jgi:uncharacterized GH25 family protein